MVLQSLQDQFGAPIKCFQQDVSTRWNSSYYMLESLGAKANLGCIRRRPWAPRDIHSIPVGLNREHPLFSCPLWAVNQRNQLLWCICSGRYSFDCSTKTSFEQRAWDGSWSENNEKHTFRVGLHTFSEIYSDPLHFIATVLDPRYKDHYLDVGLKQRAREMIQAAMDAENPPGDGEAHSAREAHSAGEGEQSACLKSPSQEVKTLIFIHVSYIFHFTWVASS